MPLVSTDIPKSLRIALDQEIARLRTDESAVVTAALSEYLGIPVHTLFQVSTSGALVEGVFDREVSVKSILEHGDFGLGTFANLNGEMVVLDGRARSTGHWKGVGSRVRRWRTVRGGDSCFSPNPHG